MAKIVELQDGGMILNMDSFVRMNCWEHKYESKKKIRKWWGVETLVTPRCIFYLEIETEKTSVVLEYGCEIIRDEDKAKVLSLANRKDNHE